MELKVPGLRIACCEKLRHKLGIRREHGDRGGKRCWIVWGTAHCRERNPERGRNRGASLDSPTLLDIDRKKLGSLVIIYDLKW